MKKIVAFMAVCVLVFSLVGCNQSNSVESSSIVEPSLASEVPSEQISAESAQEQTETSIDLQQLAPDDEVSIVGQVANSALVNGNTIWVQVQQPDKTFVIYHCQLRDEFISVAEGLQMSDVVRVQGLFLSLSDFEQENTSPLVTLYDCEIVDG